MICKESRRFFLRRRFFNLLSFSCSRFAAGFNSPGLQPLFFGLLFFLFLSLSLSSSLSFTLIVQETEALTIPKTTKLKQNSLLTPFPRRK